MAEPDAAASDPPRPAPRPTVGDLVSSLAAPGRPLAAVLAVVVLVGGAAVAGYSLLRTPPAPATEALLPYAPGVDGAAGPATVAPTTSTIAAPEIVVHAAGAVAAPGVYRLPAGSRVEDVLAAAGGPAPEADLDRVNLAAAVADGERVWIPRVGEAGAPAVAGAPPAGGPADEGSPAVIDLNTASAEQLEALPGIGPATAAAIVEHRDRHGPFRSVDDLLDVPGIGDAKLAQLRDLVSV